MTLKKNRYETLERVLKEKGIKHEDFAKSLHITPSALSKIISRSLNLKYDMACRIAKELCLTPDSLFFIDHNK